ncbi:MAG: ferric reductase-like transmembrane domain-containing protein [Anaerolineae bacterium]|nr:ferric reductase-like transmembrane domain-containing protein [Anaerolineae bacterium]
MKRTYKAALWLAILGVIVLAPLAIILLGPRTPQREWLRELSVIVGFIGLSLIGIQFIPLARLSFLSTVFDMDTLYRVHHLTSLLGFGLALAHPLMLFIHNPYTLRLLNVVTAPWRARAGVAAILLLIAIAATSAWRKQLEIDYEGWHWAHDILSLLIAATALYHILRVNYYTAVPAQRVLWIVLGALWGLLLLYIRVIRPWTLLRRPYVVSALAKDRCECWALTLQPVGHDGMRYAPGQFAWLKLWGSPFGIEYHPFSIASSAERAGQIEFMIKDLGDWTSRLGEVQVGQRAYVDGPYGVFGPDAVEAPGYAFVAGGSGISPFMSILRTLADRGDQRPLILFYGNPVWDTVIYRDEIATFKERLNLRVVHVLQKPPPGWEGETGYINADILSRHLPRERNSWAYMLCGPLPMIDAVTHALHRLGIPPLHVHEERYEMA